MGNKNSSNTKVHVKTTKVSSIAQQVPKQDMMSFPTEKVHRIKGTTTLRDDEYIGKQKIETPLDSDETFNSFIRRAKYKIRTVTMSKSNIDRDQSYKTSPAAPDQEENDQREQFDDFIQIAKKKMRATSSIRNNSFFKKP
ncbi:uncharacterized protein LOC131612498 [Vicia villosa]|uniref:uncharacterized protein LOC131612498 n=1 Tax=Vicia villosa TaxID=3911 RepID=UPI00273C6B2A|nr:uncharacterized protein LOC131612498 [Vicia villosa]